MKTTTNATPLLLIDGNNLLYRAAYGFPAKVYNKKKENITTIFAFFALLRIAFHEVGFPLSPIICFDGEHSLDARRGVIPSYKENRVDNRLNPYGDLPLIIESLRQLQIPVVIEDQLESDDLIAHFVHSLNPQLTFILSCDKDFYQLINENVFVLNTMRKGVGRRIGKDQVFHTHGVYPEQWVYYRALMGDPADFIKGVKGVGAKTAQKLIQLQPDEMREILETKYQTSWDDFEQTLGIIELGKESIVLSQRPKFQPIFEFGTPAEVIKDLDLWN